MSSSYNIGKLQSLAFQCSTEKNVETSAMRLGFRTHIATIRTFANLNIVNNFWAFPVPYSNYKLTVYPAYNTSNKFDSVLRASFCLLALSWIFNDMWTHSITLHDHDVISAPCSYDCLINWIQWGSQGIHRATHTGIVIAAQQDHMRKSKIETKLKLLGKRWQY